MKIRTALSIAQILTLNSTRPLHPGHYNYWNWNQYSLFWEKITQWILKLSIFFFIWRLFPLWNFTSVTYFCWDLVICLERMATIKFCTSFWFRSWCHTCISWHLWSLINTFTFDHTGRDGALGIPHGQSLPLGGTWIWIASVVRMLNVQRFNQIAHNQL